MGSGYIQEDKLGYALERCGITVDETALNLMIKVADLDKDGQISRHEWSSLVHDMSGQLELSANQFDSLRSPRSRLRAGSPPAHSPILDPSMPLTRNLVLGQAMLPTIASSDGLGCGNSTLRSKNIKHLWIDTSC